MPILHYQPTDFAVWQGRTDSDTNYDAFRWHQWIKPLDLNHITTPFNDDLGIAFLGFCCDEGIRLNKGRYGAAEGPHHIRKELNNLPCFFTQDVKLYDAGNIDCEGISLIEAQSILSKAVERLLALNLFPIVLGGGHEIAYGHYNGIVNHLFPKQIQAANTSVDNPKKLGIINFDAHFDLRPYNQGSSSGTMFRQIADDCESTGRHYGYCCLGVQRRGNTIDLFKTADRLGVDYLLAETITTTDIHATTDRLDRFMEKHDHLYVTICSDVFASAFAPGVSAAQPLGLFPEKALKVLKHIVQSNKVTGFDIAEVSPRFDHDHSTASLAATILFAVVNSLASNKGLALEI